MGKQVKTAESFWKKVKIGSANECWEFIAGYHNSRGYGTLYFQNRNQMAHRVAYMFANNLDCIPDGMQVCHTCDNPPCCNPAHLWLGTNTDNTNDKMKKGRHRPSLGENNGNCLLTEDQVKAIRLEYVKGKVGYRTLGKRYGTHPQNIKNIVTGKIWKWLA